MKYECSSENLVFDSSDNSHSLLLDITQKQISWQSYNRKQLWLKVLNYFPRQEIPEKNKMEKNILNFKVAQSQFIERLELNHESVLRFDS